MKVISPGHKYGLDNFEEPGANGQALQFIEKEPDPHGGDVPILVNDGTTNEEVLRMLIDRMQYLNGKLPNRYTSIALTHCEEALMWLEKRTSERKARGVEGTYKP